MSCKKIDALRLKKYISCFIGKSHNLPLEEFCTAAKAPVEHLFNCHEWCDPSWCWAKELSQRSFESISQKIRDGQSDVCIFVDDQNMVNTNHGSSLLDCSSDGSDYTFSSSDNYFGNDDDMMMIILLLYQRMKKMVCFHLKICTPLMIQMMPYLLQLRDKNLRRESFQ